MAATDGPTANWQKQGGGTGYDFNDSSCSPAGCNSGSDGDGLAGRLSVDPSVSTVTPEPSCSSTGISKGSSTAFNQGSVDAIGLLIASSATPLGCYWDVTGIGLSQQIPTAQLSGDYVFDVTLTAVVQ